MSLKDALPASIYEPIQSERLYQQIVEQIEKLILSGTLKVGDKLSSERELAEQFGVSRTAVREAVKALREKGLVEVHPGRGTFITNSTSQVMRDSLNLLMKMGHGNIWDLIDVREILEPEVAARAALARDKTSLIKLKKAVAQMDATVGQAGAWLEADLQFHRALAAATLNIILYHLVDSITDLRREYFSHLFFVPSNIQQAQRQHKLILDAIIRQDPEAARTATRTHLQHIREECATVVTPAPAIKSS